MTAPSPHTSSLLVSPDLSKMHLVAGDSEQSTQGLATTRLGMVGSPDEPGCATSRLDQSGRVAPLEFLPGLKSHLTTLLT
jgi:hypothetical protein